MRKERKMNALNKAKTPADKMANSKQMRSIISAEILDHINVIKVFGETQADTVVMFINMVLQGFQRNGKLLMMGNGGSAADAQHIAAELVARFKAERKALPAIALTTDTSILTAMGNDYGYDAVFSRQVAALAQPQDVVVGISTSGNSKNVLQAIQVATDIGCQTVGLTGQDGGALAKMVNLAIRVPSQEVSRIQEAHITIGHIMCGLVEQAFVN